MPRRSSAVLAVSMLFATAAVAWTQPAPAPAAEAAANRETFGWSLVPVVDYAFLWDSNVLFDNAVGAPVADLVHVLRPTGTLRFTGRRTRVGASYAGALVQHREMSSINSYDHRAEASASRLLSRRTSMSGRYSFTASPTTELEQLVGVPYLRVGTTRHDAQGGLELTLSRRTEASLLYRFQQVEFEETPFYPDLRGGLSHGATGRIARALTRRWTLSGEYQFDRATVADGSYFNVQNAWSALEYIASDRLRLTGGGGVSHLSSVAGRPARIGPVVRLGVAYQLDRAQLRAGYSRAFVPSYSFGGTTDNEELTAGVQVPLARRVLARSSLSLRRNEPLDRTDLSLRSLAIDASLAYLLNDWLSLEGYSTALRQNIERPGGRLNRYQFGLRLSAGTTTRIR